MTLVAPAVVDQWQYQRPKLYQKQESAVFDPARFSFIEAGTKSGKSLRNGSLVQTPDGPRAIETLLEGDEVFAADGSVCRVDGVYPQGELDTWRVTFSDGASVECSEDHLWAVHADKRDYRRGFQARLEAGEITVRRSDHRPWPRVMTLRRLMEYSEKRRRRMWVQMTGELQYPESKELPLTPYLLGVLIAEGGMTTTSTKISSADHDVLESVRREIPDGHSLRLEKPGGCTYVITAGKRGKAMADNGTHINQRLKTLGLWGLGSHKKFIPVRYKQNTVGVRLDVLRGIFDGDGSVDSSGQAVLEQTSARLASDVTEVIESLGGCARTTVKRGSYRDAVGEPVACRMVYRTRVRYADCKRLFSLRRKQILARPKRREVKRTFRSIEHVGRADCTCISVDHPCHLFLTDHHIVTHNTVGCMAWIWEQAWMGQSTWNHWWIAPYYVQATIAYTRMKAGTPPQTRKYNDNDKVLSLNNGSFIWFKSAEKADAMYGEDVYSAVVDEASRVRQESWWALRSTLTATQAPARIIGNVKGQLNWAFRLGRKAKAWEESWDGEGPKRYAFHRITALDAVNAGIFPREEMESAREDLPEDVFNELYMAEATELGTNPFGIQAIRDCIIAPVEDSSPVVWGWDLARKRDWTVGVGLDAYGRVADLVRFQMSWPDTVKRIIEATGRMPALVDSTGVGDVVLQQLERDGGRNYDGFLFTQRSKQQIMEGLSLAIQRGEVYFQDGVLVDELESFEYEHSRNGVSYSAPLGMHDDCVCALALARQLLVTTKIEPADIW